MDDNVVDNEFDQESEDIEYAGFWIRVGAALIDSLILAPLVALEIYNKITLHSVSVLVAGTTLAMLYKPYLEYTRGATIGKQLLNLRVITEEYGALTLNHAVLRYMPWFISAFFGLMLGFEYYSAGEYADSFLDISIQTQDSFWNKLNAMYAFVFLAIVVVVAFDPRKQGLHDKIAQTYVIKD